MRGNVGSFAVAYDISFFSLFLSPSFSKAFQAPTGTIALNKRFITRKRPFMNSTMHFYVAFCPTLSLIPTYNGLVYVTKDNEDIFAAVKTSSLNVD